MKLTDKELNFVLSECVKQMLNEYDTVGPLNKTAQYQQKNNYSINTDGVTPVAGVNFMDDTWDGTIYNYPDEYDTKAKISKNKKNVNRNLLKAGAKTIAGFTVGSIVAIALGPIGMIPLLFKSIRGGRKAISSLVKSHQRYKMLNSFKIPKNKETAKELAILAATERADLQNQCNIAQQNLFKSIKAFNETYSNGTLTLSWEDLKSVLSKTAGKFPLANELGGGEIEVNTKTNFNDINVTESKLFENEFSQTVQSKFTFNKNNIDDAMKTVVSIGELYCELYRLWFSFTRYIQILIAKYPKYLNWKNIISSVGKVDNEESLWSEILGIVAPTSKRALDLKQAFDKRNSENDENEEVSDKDIFDSFKQTTFTVNRIQFSPTNSPWGGGKQSKVTYTTFQDQEGREYALQTNLTPKAVIGNTFTVTNMKKYITDTYISSDTNNDIRILSPSILSNAKPI